MGDSLGVEQRLAAGDGYAAAGLIEGGVAHQEREKRFGGVRTPAYFKCSAPAGLDACAAKPAARTVDLPFDFRLLTFDLRPSTFDQLVAAFRADRRALAAADAEVVVEEKLRPRGNAFGVVAPATMQRTALHEDRGARARSVVQRQAPYRRDGNIVHFIQSRDGI